MVVGEGGERVRPSNHIEEIKHNNAKSIEI